MLVVILNLGLVVCDQFFLMLQIDVNDLNIFKQWYSWFSPMYVCVLGFEMCLFHRTWYDDPS